MTFKCISRIYDINDTKLPNVFILFDSYLIGINQIQWALEFLKCLKVDYNYPESIGKIVKTIEKVMIELYSKINIIQYKAKLQEPSVELKDSMSDSKS